MARKKDFYMVLDTETCTLPFADELGLSPAERKNLAIMKPLVYDIGWQIVDRHGNVYKAVSYLVQETFFVPKVFNTAYYREKRPLYIDKLNKGEIIPKLWNDICKELEADLQSVKMATAYNACFDFKKAIPFTERYMKALYSNNFDGWLYRQKKQVLRELKSKNPEYLDPVFEFRNNDYPIVDLWGETVSRLLNNEKYKKMLLEQGRVTASAHYYKTSAETAFQYISQDIGFIEEHTALSDAKIESIILAKVLKKGKIEPNIKPFPFRELGNPIEDCRTKKGYGKYRNKVLDMFCDYLQGYEKDKTTKYFTRMVNEFDRLNDIW